LINTMCVGHVTRDSDFDALLGCEDNCVRVLQGSVMAAEVPASSSVTALGLLSSKDKGGSRFLVGQGG
jgi:hypothetical protein